MIGAVVEELALGAAEDMAGTLVAAEEAEAPEQDPRAEALGAAEEVPVAGRSDSADTSLFL